MSRPTLCVFIEGDQYLLDESRLAQQMNKNLHAGWVDQPHDVPLFLRAALEYAASGLRVIPLRRRSKNPFMHDWTRHASRDPRVITPWFRRWPTSNIGIATGSGIFAIDVDPDKGGEESLNRLVLGRSLPRTAEALTGGGGKHLLLRVPSGIRINNVQGFRPGIDIRGDGGLIVVEPSIHPVTHREYTWLIHPKHIIAEVPHWLIAFLKKAGLWIVEEACTKNRVRPQGSIETVRDGDADALLAEMIAKYPVNDYGQRNGRMVQVLGSLLGRALKPDLAYAVTAAWWHHYYGLGVIGTSPSAAPRAIGAAIRSILRSPNFQRPYGKVDHLAACRQIHLNAEQCRMLGMKVEELRSLANALPGKSRGEEESQDRNGSTQMWDRLCVSETERYFVEALIVHVAYERVVSRDGVIRMTGDQVRAIAADRHVGVNWNREQIRRLKDKYITRSGRSATRFELLRETRRGGRRRGQSVGIPSECEVTGIELFLKPSVGRSAK